MTTLSFDITFSNNVIAVLDGVPCNELQTGRHLYEDLIDAKQVQQLPSILYYRIEDSSGLFSVLDDIERLCIDQGLKPIIHLEAHGGKDSGINVGDTREKINWSQLVDAFRKINIACKNNLGVVMAACHGLYAISPLHISEPCPYFFLIGAEEAVSAGHIDTVMFPFYKKLHSSGNLSRAMDLINPKFKQFYAEEFFCVSFGKYLINGCFGKRGSARRERLVTEYFEKHDVPKTAANLALVRGRIKCLMKSPKASFDRLSRIFLHGRHHIHYAKLEKFVRDGQRHIK